MRTRKNALLIFSKPPVPKLVKTRLSTIKDGSFTPEIAAWLYHCMLFDVVEICCDALRDLETSDAEFLSSNSALNSENSEQVHDEYSLIVSTTPPEMLRKMQETFDESGTWPRPITIISDKGSSFDEHYSDAFNQVWEMGFDNILSMGADMPALPRRVVLEGFSKLHAMDKLPGGGCVISPDQAMGVSLIGWTRDTDMDHMGVFYNVDGITVLPAYVAKARERGVRLNLLEAVVDVDSMLDLMHNSTLVDAISYCAQFEDISVPKRTLDALKYLGWDDIRVAPNELRDSRKGIDV